MMTAVFHGVRVVHPVFALMYPFQRHTRTGKRFKADFRAGDIAWCLRHIFATVIERGRHLITLEAVTGESRTQTCIPCTGIEIQRQFYALAACAARITVFTVARRDGVADDGIAAIEAIQCAVQPQFAIQKCHAQTNFGIAVGCR